MKHLVVPKRLVELVNEDLNRRYPHYSPTITRRDYFDLAMKAGADRGEFQSREMEKLRKQYPGLPDEWLSAELYSNKPAPNVRSSSRHESIAAIASVLSNGTAANVGDVCETLQGKNILVFGDDTGSLTEALHGFGAWTTGIEYDRYKVLIARAGLLSSNGRRTDIFQGDIYELVDAGTGLSTTIEARAPFDVIYSTEVFKKASGGDCCRFNARIKPLISKIGREKLSREAHEELSEWDRMGSARDQWVLLSETSRLLQSSGYHIHTGLYESFADLFNDFHPAYGCAIPRNSMPYLKSSKADGLAIIELER